MALIRLTLSFFRLLNENAILSKKGLFWTLLLSCAVALLDLFSVVIILPLMTILNSGNSIYEFGSHDFVLNEVLFIVILVYLMRTILAFYFLKNQSRFVYDCKRNLTNYMVTNHFENFSFLRRNYSTADITKKITIDATLLSTSFFLPVLQIFSDVLLIGVFIILMLKISVLSTVLFILSVSSLTIFVIKRNRVTLKETGSRRSNLEQYRVSLLKYVLENTRSIKFNGEEELNLALLGNNDTELTNQESIYLTRTQTPRYIVELIGIVSLMLITFVLSVYDPKALWIMFATFVGASFRMLPALNRIVKARNAIQYSSSIIEQLIETLVRSSDSYKLPIAFSNGVLCFNQGSYEMGFATFVVKESFYLSPGDKVIVDGPSGIGKSLFLSAILDSVVNIDVSKYLIDQNDGLYEDILVREYLQKFREGSASSLPNNLFDDFGQIENKLIKELSGGERRRLLLIPTIMHKYELLILDEVFVGIEDARIEKIAKKVLSEHNLVLCVSHNIRIKALFDSRIKISDRKEITFEKNSSLY